MKLIWCDVCGEVLESEETKLVFSPSCYIKDKTEFILCKKCYEKLMRREYVGLANRREKNLRKWSD